MFKAINSLCYMVPVVVTGHKYDGTTDTWTTYLYSEEFDETVTMDNIKKGSIGDEYIIPDFYFKTFVAPKEG